MAGPTGFPVPRHHPWRWAALALVVLSFCTFWFVFLCLGAAVAVDTHLTNRPQDYPQFNIGAWRSGASGGSGSTRTGILTRQATMPLTFFTLRYTQESEDAGASTATVAYNADVRWGPTSLAIALSGAAVARLCMLVRRLLRVPSEDEEWFGPARGEDT